MTKDEITPELIKSYVMEIPINIAGDNHLLSEYASKLTDCAPLAVGIALSAASAFKTVRAYGCPSTSTLTFNQLEDWSEKCRVNFSIVHRVNHLMYQYLLEMIDSIEERKMRRGNSQKYLKPIQKEFNRYISAIRTSSSHVAYMAWQDHMRLSNDIVAPAVEDLYVSVRDSMIGMGESFREFHHIKDIGFLAKAEVVLLLSRMSQYTFRDYFKQFKDECGVDFTKHYSYADMGNMTSMFLKMLGELGVSFEFNDHNDLDIRGFDYRDHIRSYSAWNKILEAVRDEDAVDEAAEKAISLNPEVEKEFADIVKSVSEENMASSLEQLKEKYNVKSLKP